MKYLIFNMLLVCVKSSVSVKSFNKDYNFYPNLPMGEYRVYPKAIIFCSSNRDSDVQTNLYLNRKSKFVTELKGNMTLKIPFDDSLKLDINFAVKDSIGGWKDNALLYQSSKLCSTLKKLMGIEWDNLIKSGGNNYTNCPVPPGVYISQGYDLSNLGSNYDIPKIFFYGTYKVRINYLDINNKSVGCIIYVIEIKRPWETA